MAEYDATYLQELVASATGLGLTVALNRILTRLTDASGVADPDLNRKLSALERVRGAFVTRLIENRIDAAP